jgi:long-chain acyl-CoA synthetase
VAQAGYFTPDTRVLLLLPLHHVLRLAGSLAAPLFAGSTIVFATSLAGEALVATLRRNAVTTIIGVPRFYDMLARALRERIQASLAGRALFALAGRVSSRAFSRLIFGSVHRKLGGRLSVLVSGGAALSLETARTFEVLGFYMCEGYGMTECAPMITFPRLEQLKLGACGQALPGCEVRIQDGEIVARGPNVMRGYYGRPEETAAILRDGWLHTGDLGRLDEQGRLFVTGRLKEILVLPSGKNVNPATAEAALQAAGAVREAGVFLDGDTLHALVVPNWDELPISDRREAEEWLRREVIAPYNATVAPYRRLAGVTIVSAELPRTRLGKLRRHLLPALAREAARTRSEAASAPVDGAVSSRIAAFLERQCRRPVSAESRLEGDLGLDSLGRVELAVFLERAFGLALPDTRLVEFDTVGALARFVAEYTVERESRPDVSWSDLLKPARPPALPRSSLWHRGLVCLSRVFVRLYFRTRVRGMERLPEGPYILAPNHQSFIDGLFVTAHMPSRAVLRTLFYAKEKHIRQWWLKFLAQRNNVVVIKSDEGILQSLQKLAAGLKRGNNVMIFPEGTRSASGALGVFKESYAILARELAVPVVPVVIDGAHRVLPTGRLWPRLLGKVSVTYLDPVQPREGEEASGLNERVRALIEECLRLNRAQAEHA